ncbi:MAG: TadE/TadG family type IV pilus assembly protein [Candidatus Limnocylindrales bacterium]
MRRRRQCGQALVEFALAVTVFLLLLMGVVDLGRGIYMYNGVSQAAREIARVASVHPGSTLGTSAQAASVIATQQGLIPNLGTPTFTCVDISGAPIHSSTTCVSGDFVKVVVSAPFSPVTPLLGLTGTWNLQSTSIVQIQ